MIFTILGLLSAIIFVIADIPYLRDTIKGTTKPHRVTWGVVVFLNVVGFANQFASGADNSLWIFAAAVVMTASIFIASLKNGVGGQSKSDIFSLITCSLGVILWLVFKDPVFSIFANIFVGFVALLPTYKKTKKDPDSETKITWLLGTISTMLAAISVGELNVMLLLLPVSSTFLQGYMVYLLYIRPKNSKN
jgi:hypothetical protein